VILVDSSVWIDFFRGTRHRQTDALADLLDSSVTDIAVADLVVFEVMRGFRYPVEQRKARQLLLTLEVVEIGGLDNALLAAAHYNALRAQGVTIRSPIDILLASFCIHHGHQLLHRDADFDVIETLRGLSTWPR